MPTHNKSHVKSRVTQKSAPISLKDELDAEEPIEAPADTPFAAPVEIEPDVAEPAVTVEPAVVAAVVTTSVVPSASEPAPETAALALDPTALPLKTLDLINENAAAVLDFALALGKAESVGDALELQSRFASERYSSLVRQAGELADLTRRLAFQSGPMKLGFSAFVG
jgi:hypothetical protein